MPTYLKYNMNGASSWIFNIILSLFWSILLIALKKKSTGKFP